MRAVLLVLIAALPIAAAAGESRWVSVGTASSGIETSIDRETLVRGNGNVTVWLKFTNGGKPMPGGDQRVTEHKARVRYACEAMTVTYLTESLHDRNGTYIKGGPVSSVEAITPESVNETIWRALCASN